MSEEENSSGVPSLGHGLEYDLWEGQFQFVGGVNGQEEEGDGSIIDLFAVSGDDGDDLFRDRNGNRPDKCSLNGVKNRKKKAWCADLNDKVSLCNCYLFKIYKYVSRVLCI